MTEIKSDEINNKILTLSEVSKQTGYHPDYLGFLCRTDKLKGFRIGRNWMTTQANVDEFVKNHKNGIKEIIDDTGKKIPVHIISLPDKPEKEDFAKAINNAPQPELLRQENLLLQNVSNSLKAPQPISQSPQQVVKLSGLRKEVLEGLENKISALTKNLTEIEKNAAAKADKLPSQTAASHKFAAVPLPKLSERFASNFNLTDGNNYSNTSAGESQAPLKLRSALDNQKVKQLFKSFSRPQTKNLPVIIASAAIALTGLLGSFLWSDFAAQNELAGKNALTKIVYQQSAEKQASQFVDKPASQLVNQTINKSVNQNIVNQVLGFDQSEIYSAIDNKLNQYLAEGKFKGETGPQGVQGPAGVNGVQGGVTVVPAVQANNFPGATIFSATDLSGTNGVFTNLSGNSLSVSGGATFNGAATFTGTTTIANLSVVNVNPGFAFGSVIFQGQNGLSQDVGNLFYSASTSQLSLGTSTPEASAILQLESTTKGFLAPRMSQIQRDTIVNPATGLFVFNTDSNGYEVYNGTTWSAMGSSNGNASVATGTPNSFAFYSSSNLLSPQNSLFVSGGNVGVGTSTPNQKLSVAGNAYISGALFDSGNASGTAGMILSSTGDGTSWIATSTLIGGNALTSLNGQTGSAQIFVASSSEGLDLNISSSANTHTFKIQPAGGYTIPLTASTTKWNNFSDSPISFLTAGTGMTFSGTSTVSISPLAVMNVATGTAGNIFNIATSTNSLTINLPFASATSSGQLSVADWNKFNDKQAAGNYFIQGGNTFTATGTLGTLDNFGLNFVTNSTTKMTILANGNIGIGTTSPQYGLDVETGSIKVSNNITGVGQSGTLYLGDGSITKTYGSGWSFNGALSSSGNFQAPYGNFYGAPTIPTTLIVNGGTLTGNPTSGYGLQVGASTGATNNYAATFMGGNVGIGTTSPSKLLEVSSSVNSAVPTIRISGWKGSAGDIGALSFYENNYNNQDIANIAASRNGNGANYGELRFSTTNGSATLNEAMRITSSGNVGIGTTSPSQLLTVGNNNQFTVSSAGYVTSAVGIAVKNATLTYDGSNRANLYGDGGVNLNYWNGSSVITGLAVQAATGNIGISTTTPTQKLVVNGNAYITGSLYDSTYSAGISGQILSSTGSGTQWVSTTTFGSGLGAFVQGGNSFGTTATLGTNDNNALAFKTNSTTRMTVLANGNVGIGTTSPVATLDVLGAINIPNTTNSSFGVIEQNGNPFIHSYNGVFMGLQSGSFSSTGVQNLGIGNYTLNAVTSGQQNTAIGQGALYRITTGSYNVAVGVNTLTTATSSQSNMAIGQGSLSSNTAGSFNVGIGVNSLQNNLTGNYNIAIGNLAGTNNNTGNNITLIGSGSNVAADGLTNAAAIGYNAQVASSNSLVLGGTGANAVNVGIGVVSPAAKLDVAGNIQVAGNIMPEMTGASGAISTRTIGDATHRFSDVWANDVHIGASSLYVNGKKVITDVSNVMNFTTDLDQSMIVKSSGIGSMGLQTDMGTLFLNSNSLISANGVGGIALTVPATNPSENLNLTNSSLNGNITFTTTGNNSQILASAVQKISLTAPSIELNGAVTGNTTWSGNVIDTAHGGTATTTIGSAGSVAYSSGSAYAFSSSGIPGQVLISQGAGAPIWQNAATIIGGQTVLQGGNSFGTAMTVGTTDNNNLSFQTNSTTRITLLTNGNVGIGTTSPASVLNVVYPASRTSTVETSVLRLQSNDLSAAWYLDLTSVGGSNITQRNFNFQTRMYDGQVGGNINLQPGGGNVGIGTTSPVTTLDVSQSSYGSYGPLSLYDGYYRYSIGGSSVGPTGPNNSYLSLYKLSNIAHIASNNSIYIDASNTAMSILTNGNVGIGTTSPGTKLEVAGATTINGASVSGAATYLMLKNAGANVGILGSDGAITGGSATDFGLYVYNSGQFDLSTGGAKRLSVTSGGNVGIGTTTPGGQLDVLSSGTGEVRSLQISNSSDNSGSSRSVVWKATGSGYNFDIAKIKSGYGTAYNNSSMTFSVADGSRVLQDRMTIDRNGNVGIGTTSPSELLQIYNGNVQLNNGYGIKGMKTDGTTGLFAYVNSSNNVILGDISNKFGGGVGLTTQGSANPYLFINSSGNVGIGTTSPGANLAIQPASNNSDTFNVYRQNGTKVVNVDTTNSYLNVTGNIYASSQYLGASGSASNPEYSFATEAGTGMYRGGAGILSFANLGVNVMTLNNGNVGIGTTSPSGRLDVVGSYSSNFAGHTILGDNGSYNPTIAQYKWTGTGSNYYQTTISNSLSASGSMDFQLGTGNSSYPIGSDTQTTRMTILTNGNVGIGTTTPGASLDVYGAVASIRVGDSATSRFLTLGAQSTSLDSTNNTLYLNRNSSQNIILANGGGNVGIGTTSPGSILQVQQSNDTSGITISGSTVASSYLKLFNDVSGYSNINASAGFRLQQAGTSIAYISTANTDGFRLYDDIPLSFGSTPATRYVMGRDSTSGNFLFAYGGVISTSTNVKLAITPSGNVGIGTTSPSQLLTVGNNNQFTVSAAGAVNMLGTLTTPGFAFDEALGEIRVRGTANPLTIYTNSAERMRIDSSGNVGIGTTSPGYALDVYNSGTGLQIVSQFASAGGGFKLGSWGSGYAGFWSNAMTPTASNYALLAGSTTTYLNASASVGLVIGGNAIASINANGMSINNGTTGPTSGNGLIVASGNVGVGTTTPSAKLTVVGSADIITGSLDLDNTTFTNQYGLITKNGSRFLSDFNYGNNGTVTTTGDNIFVGLNSGNMTMGSTAAAIYHASYNSALGYQTLASNTTGYYNTAVGANSLQKNTIGYTNVAVGAYALQNNLSGYLNTALGPNALLNSVNGYSNTAVGYDAGRFLADGSSVASSTNTSLYLGYGTKAYSNSDSNSIIIGYNAVGIGSNSVVLGNDSIVTTALKGNVGIGTISPTTLLDVEASTSSGSYGTYPSITVGNTNTSGAAYSALSFISGNVNQIGVNGLGGQILLSANNNSSQYLWMKTTAVTYPLYLSSGNSTTTGITILGSNVGIGTTSPQAKLDVYSSVNQANPAIRISGWGTGDGDALGNISFVENHYYNQVNAQIQSYRSGPDANYGALAFSVTRGSSVLNEAMRISNSGNVGIGTTAPSYKLSLASTAAGAGIDGLIISQTDSTAVVTHSSKFMTQQTGSGNGRTLFYAASPTNLTTSGQFDIVTEGGGKLMSSNVYTAGSGSIFNLNADAGTAISLNTYGNSYLNGGNVGIGTTSPSQLLTVGNNNQFIITSVGTVSAASYLINGSSNGILGNTANAVNLYGYNGINFQYWGGSAATTGMVLNNNGNVGIGTTSPATMLQVYSDNEAIRIGQNDNATSYIGFGSNGAGLRAQVGFAAINYGSDSGYAFLSGGLTGKGLGLDVNGSSTPAVYINSIGNVGVGTTSPAAKLDVYSSTPGAYAMSVLNTSTGGGNGLYVETKDGNAAHYALFVKNSGSNVLVIPNNVPNVGIGTTSPQNKLHIYGNAPIAQIDSSNTTGYGPGLTYSRANVTKWFNQVDSLSTESGNNQLDWLNGSGTQVMSLLQSGNVGIGTTSPQDKLDIYGNLRISNSSDGTKYGTILSGSSGEMYIRPSNAALYLSNGVNAYQLNIYNGATGTVRINSAGNSYINGGNVGIGTTTPLSTANRFLQIADGSSAGITLTQTGATPGSYSLFANSTGNFGLYDERNSAYRIFVASSTGNVGIGTTSPANKLDVNGIASVSRLAIGTTDITAGGALPNSTTQVVIQGQDGATVWGIANSSNVRRFALNINSAGGWTMYDGNNTGANGTWTAGITQLNGNVGIGTTGPATLLDLYKNTNSTNYTGYPSLSLTNPNETGNSYSAVNFINGTFTSGLGVNGLVGQFIAHTYDNAPDYLALRSESNNTPIYLYNGVIQSNGLTISYGKVGIGTTTPEASLEVNGGLMLSGTGTSNFITPAGESVATKINIPLYDPGAFGQIMITGLPASADTTARAFSFVDNRGAAHQPTIGVFTPDEHNIAGFSWEGSNSNFYVKTTSGNVVVRSGTTDMATFLSNGNVGIGTTTPGSKFVVAGDCTGFATTGSCTDYAEIYPSRDFVEAAEVVSIINASSTAATSTQLIGKAAVGYDSNLLGVVSTNPAIIIEGGSVQFMNGSNYQVDNYRPAVALAGRVPVKVTNENGNIQPGDFLTSSNKFPGYAMKATRSGQVLGQALSAFSSAVVSDSGTVLVFIKPGYQNINNTFVLGSGDGQLSGATSTEVAGDKSQVASFLINQVGSGNLLQLQQNGEDRLLVASNGSFNLFASSSIATSTILSINNASTSLFTINAVGDINSVGHITVGKDVAGTAVIKAGDNQAVVTFAVAYNAVPKIAVTALGLPDFFYGVATKTPAGFTIQMSKPAVTDVGFDWIALAQPSTTPSQSSLNNLIVVSVPTTGSNQIISSDENATSTASTVDAPVVINTTSNAPITITDSSQVLGDSTTTQ